MSNISTAIDLDGKRNEIDTQATEIAENKESSVASRKKLAEQTKREYIFFPNWIAEFRKYTDAEKATSFGNLLKLYQEEIDKLTKRSKYAENSFFFIYKLIAEAPDPTIGLSAALVCSIYHLTLQSETGQTNRVSELEIENKKLKTELEEFRKEFQEVKDQEVTIRRLEEKIGEYENKVTWKIDFPHFLRFKILSKSALKIQRSSSRTSKKRQ